ncbi:MAG: 16S rRNA (guanine(527)-N(7))-methyltransferase RsmG [Oscillospiraceae bacterium]|nr:16S rRNA (guanine(527)-N(7))-methyltransferase RsmG [Oscillospiraceae bacterium]
MRTYLGRLLAQNRTLNLTAVRNEEEAVVRHIRDALALSALYPLAGKSVIDIGSGGGLPGIPLKIRDPSIRLTLLDATAKKVDFLRKVCDELGLADVACVAARAEEQARRPGFRDAYDVAVARGVAFLPALCELCLPFVKPGGALLAMKGGDCDDEAAAAAERIEALGGGAAKILRYALTPEITHALVIVPKRRPTPPAYPRRWAKILGDR